MRKPPTEPRDWSAASEALFRAARTDHAPNAADRQRVRSELAQRLADASNPPLAGSDSPLEAAGKTGVALSALAKIGLAVVFAVAGTLAFMRLRESSEQAEPKPVPQTSAKTSPSIPVPAPVVTSSEQPTPPLMPVQSAAAAPAARRSSGRAPSANVATRQHRGRGPEANQAPNSLDAPGEPASAAPAGPDATRHEASGNSQPGAADPQQTSSARNPTARSDDGSGRRAALKTEDDPAHPASTPAESSSTPRDSSERVATTAELDPSDPRAELVFARRMQAAMLAGRPEEVMALCSEHERRWPHGTFVQEREGLRAMASCYADARDAKARASRFLATYPRGPLVPRVRQACADQLE